MKRFAYLFALFGLTVFFSSLGYVQAQASMSPLFVKLEISQTGTSQATFSVFNGSAEPVRYRASFQPFTFGKSLELIEGDAPVEADLSPYLRAAPLEFEVPAGSEQTIRVIALVPPSVAAEELRSALVVEPLIDTTTPPEESEEGAVTGRVFYTYRFIAQIYASAPGGTATVSVMDAKYNREDGLQLGFANNGSVSGISNTNWRLMQGKKEVAVSENPGRYLILPDSTRTVVLTENLELKPGDYTLMGDFGLDDGGEPPVVLNPQPFSKTFTVK